MGNSEKELEEKIMEAGNRLHEISRSVDDLLPLLEQIESLLSKVEQSPTESMLTALNPTITGLTAKELLENADTNVRVAAATCISEITRITAPEAPYDDDLMKEIFQSIVQSFRNLDDVSSNLYPKRVSILETVAKVRSCVVMLDLECDSLILDMFHYFLSTIRENHPETVFSSMVTIMTLVLEESEDISPDLLSCLLMNVKMDNKDILPAARRLAEKVIEDCAVKLKPCLMEAVESIGAPLSDYSKVVATVCQDSSDVQENVNGVKADKNTVLANSGGRQESLGELEPEAQTVAEISNGAVQVGDGSSLGELTLSKGKGRRSRRSTYSPEEVEAGSNHRARRASSRQTEKEEDVRLPRRRRGRGRGGSRSQEKERSERTIQEDLSADKIEKSGDSARPKRGRSSVRRGLGKRRRKEAVAVNGNSTEKAVDDSDDDLEKKPLKDFARRLLEDGGDGGGVSRKIRSKMGRGLPVADSEEKPRKKRGRKPKIVVDGVSHGKQEDGDGVSEPNSKGPPASPTTAEPDNKDQTLTPSEESSQKRLRRKRAPEEGSELLPNAIKYDETLVGVKVKVWWPDDKKFYGGIVESYNPTTMKHKVMYNDGDEEDLLLKNEILKFRKGTKLGTGEKVTSTPEGTTETGQRKRRRGAESSGRRSKSAASEGRAVDGSGTTAGGKRRGRRPKSAENASGGTGSGGQLPRRRRSGDASPAAKSRGGGRRRGRRPKEPAADDGGAGGEVSPESKAGSGDQAEMNGSDNSAAGGRKRRKK